MDRIGIVGFPNVGKTSLFNALTGKNAAVGAFPYATTSPNLGIARVPDSRLDAAAALEGSISTAYPSVELLDLPAMGRPGSAGLGAEYLGRLRQMDALCVVLRAFDTPSVPAGESGTDPSAQAEDLGLELALSDAEVLARRVRRAGKEAAARPDMRREVALLEEGAAVVAEGIPLRSRSWPEEARNIFRDLAPLTLKPVVWVINADEDEADPGSLEEAVAAATVDSDAVVVLSARLEAEAGELAEDDRGQFLAEFGLGDGAPARVVAAVHQALGLVTFYTVGPKEARAWTVADGSSIRLAAGKVHSDMERGFIRAEVASIDDVIASGGWKQAVGGGKVHVEGRDYPIASGDVVHIRFSV